ncbi:hypothetical protein BU17DRAFT_30429, partial [Hysterangium stoloniferum]
PFSIVAIHGLDGASEASFTAKNDVLWLRDLLPTVITNARILTYGYDARTRGENISQLDLDDLSTDFIAKLSTFRVHSHTQRRPLIFIAHCLGGIILKNALVYAEATNDRHLPDHKAVESSTFGIIYLGTPHQGMDTTGWDRFPLRKLFSTTYQTNNKIMKHLRLSSERLQHLETRYTAISGKYSTIFCYASY